MAKKSQPIQPKKKRDNKIRIKPGKAALGHLPHQSGSGAHDNRPKRLRTRRAQNKRAIREFSY